ncbi:MAG: FecR family protein [Planctomycetota bacterium]
MTSNRTERLEPHEFIVRYFDDALSDEELRKLNAWLESSSDVRGLFNEMVLQSQAIADVGSYVRLPSGTHTMTASWNRRRIVLVGLISAAVMMTGFLFWPGHQTPESLFVGQLETITGVAGPEGNVTSGMTVYSRGAGSAAKMTYQDGTEVILDNDSRLLIEGESGKTLRLLRGHVTASVRSQPKGRPLRIRTEHALAEALGTELILDVGSDSTALSVLEGIVRLQRLSDRQSIDIHAGQFAVANAVASEKLDAKRSPAVPDEFDLTFEKRLPSGWRVGKRVVADEAFVRAQPVDGQPRGTHFQIYTQNAFYDGLPELFRIHEDTYLNLTFRMKNPGWFQIFVGVRPEANVSAERTNFLLQPSNDALKPNEWNNLHVPFSRLRNLQGNFRAAGRSAYFMLFDTQVEDRGLEIRRIWVTREPQANMPAIERQEASQWTNPPLNKARETKAAAQTQPTHTPASVPVRSHHGNLVT